MKISVVGVGNIGSNIVSQLLCTDLVIDEIAMIDIFADFAKGRAFDLSHLASVYDKDTKILGGSENELLTNSDIVVITAGKIRREGQSRDELLNENAQIVAEISKNISKFAPNAIIILVTNPLDALVWVAFKASGFAKSRIIGMAGELDSARLKSEIAKAENFKISSLKASVVGIHGDDMEILENEIYQNGVKFSPKNLEKIKENTKNGGAKVTELQKTSAFFAPAGCVVKMIKAILQNSQERLICSVLDENEIPLGRFVKLGRNGVAEILNFSYSENFEKSKEKMKNQILNLNKGNV